LEFLPKCTRYFYSVVRSARQKWCNRLAIKVNSISVNGLKNWHLLSEVISEHGVSTEKVVVGQIDHFRNEKGNSIFIIVFIFLNRKEAELYASAFFSLDTTFHLFFNITQGLGKRYIGNGLGNPLNGCGCHVAGVLGEVFSNDSLLSLMSIHIDGKSKFNFIGSSASNMTFFFSH